MHYMQEHTDRLTGLPNRQTLEERLESSFIEWMANSPKHPYTIILFDIDYFKAINDLLGKRQGDTVLSEMGSILKSSAKRQGIGILGRYGGEEFLFALPNYGWKQSYTIAGKVRRAVAGHRFIDIKTGKPTLSEIISVTLGVRVVNPREAKNADSHRKKLCSIIDEADIALDYGKILGKNRVTRFSRYLKQQFCLIQDIRRLYFTNSYEPHPKLFEDSYLRRDETMHGILQDHFKILQKYVHRRDTRTQAVFADYLYRYSISMNNKDRGLFAQFIRRNLPYPVPN